MSVRLQDLAAGPREAAIAADAELTALGIPHAITSTMRVAIEQIVFFCQGRAPLEIVNLLRQYIGLYQLAESENRFRAAAPLKPNIVTWADGVNRLSNHQAGRGLDVVPMENVEKDPAKPARWRAVWPGKDDPRWQGIAVVMKKHGFSWGGDWPEPKTDRPHYEMAV